LCKTVSSSKGEIDNGGLSERKDVSLYYERDAQDLAQRTNQVLDQALMQYIDKYPSYGMIQSYSQVVKVQKTPPKGGFHKWHFEHGADIDSRNRSLVWMIYLNDCPKNEGSTEFLEYGRTIFPEEGSVVLFPAAWTHAHRGNPVYGADKYIATGWYYWNG